MVECSCNAMLRVAEVFGWLYSLTSTVEERTKESERMGREQLVRFEQLVINWRYQMCVPTGLMNERQKLDTKDAGSVIS